MSRSVEDKVVKMSLENRGFMSKVKESISGLGILDKNLRKSKNVDFSKATASLSNLGRTAKSTNMNALQAGVENVKYKFSAMSAVALGALMRIGSAAVSAGAKVIRSFTLDPIIGGFQMYESKLKAIQVIMANTQGKSTYGEVTQSLKELNDYANKTVYSFQDMTTNMGTFTAAGVDLKTAQTAIEGISNLAAASGSSTQQASMAMYQLSQAIASGKVGLQDWNSVVNAGMGGKKFQTALQETAKKMGKNIDASESFRDSLKDGWLTTDVLMKTLDKFSKDPSMLHAATQAKTFSDVMDAVDDELKSGWATTWELLIGDFKQAPKLWSGVSKVITGAIQSQSNARNELIKGFDALGGRTDLIKGLSNVFKTLGQIVGAVSKAFHDVFPPATAAQLATIAAKFREFTHNLILSKDEVRKFRDVFRGVFSVFDIAFQIIKRVGQAFLNLIPKGTGGSILDLAAKVGRMIYAFDQSLKSGKSMGESLKGLRISTKGLSGIFGTLGKIVGDVFNKIAKASSIMSETLVPVFKVVGKKAADFAKTISFDDILKGGSLISLVAIAKSFKKFTGVIDDVAESVGDAFKGLGDSAKSLWGFKDALSAIATGVNASALMSIAIATTALAVSLKLISGIPVTGIFKSLETIALALIGMIKVLKIISKLDFAGTGTFKAATLLIAVSNALIMLAGALKIMSTIDTKDMGKSLLALAATMTILVGALAALSKIQGKMTASAIGIQALAGAIVVLSGALVILAHIDTGGLIQGLIAIAALMAEISIFSKSMSAHPIPISSAIAVKLISTSLVVMSAAIGILGTIPFGTLLQGLIGIAGVLAEISVFSKMVNGSGMIQASIGMNLIATALNLLAPPIIVLGSIPLPSLAQGLIAMAIALGEVVIALKLAQGGLAGAAAITATAVGVALLVPPLVALSAVPLSGIAAALIALAGAFTIIGIAGAVAGSIAPGLIALSVSVGAVGLAMTGAALLVGAFAAAFAIFAGATTSGVNNAIKSFNSLLRGLNTSVPLIIKLAERCMLGMVDSIARSAPQIANAGLKLILGLLKAISSHIFEIAKVGVDIVVKFAAAMTESMPRLVEAGVALIISTINSMANAVREHGDDIIQAVQNLIEAILELLITAFQHMIDTTLGWFPPVKKATKGMGDAAKKSLRDAFQVKDVGKKGGKDFVNGVNSKKGDANKAGGNLSKNAKNGSKTDLKGNGSNGGKTFVDALNSHKGGAHGAGRNLKNNANNGSKTDLRGNGSHGGSTYVRGVNSNSGGAHGAGRNLGSKAKSGSNVSLHNTGYNVGQGFVNGLGSGGLLHGVWNAAWSLGRQAIAAVKAATDSHSPSKKAIAIGQYFSEGFAIGINNNAGMADKEGNNLGKNVVEVMRRTAGIVQQTMDDALNYSPVITPVVDDSNLKKLNTNGYGIPTAMLASGAYNPAFGQQSNQPVNVKMDLKPLEDKIEKLSNQDPVNLNLTVYGSLDSVTARKWAGTIAEALEKVRKRQGGSYY